jgi:hypothetical protein
MILYSAFSTKSLIPAEKCVGSHTEYQFINNPLHASTLIELQFRHNTDE